MSAADNVTPIRPEAGAPLTRREARLVERFRLLSPTGQVQLLGYARYVANLPRGSKILSSEEWQRSRRAGAQQAVAMLREIEAQDTGYCINEPDSPQDTSVIARHLGGLAPEHVEGFAAILTDFLGSALKGAGSPDVELFERMLGEGRI